MSDFILSGTQFFKMTREERFWTYFFHGQSCANCKFCIQGICTNDKHLENFEMGRNELYDEIRIKIQSQSKNVFIYGSLCEDWELIEI